MSTLLGKRFPQRIAIEYYAMAVARTKPSPESGVENTPNQTLKYISSSFQKLCVGVCARELGGEGGESVCSVYVFSHKWSHYLSGLHQFQYTHKICTSLEKSVSEKMRRLEARFIYNFLNVLKFCKSGGNLVL